MPVAGADRDAAGRGRGVDAEVAAALFPDMPGNLEWSQQRGRRRSVSQLAASGVLDPDPTIATQYGTTFIIGKLKGLSCQVIDLPMPGRVAGAVALAGRVTRIDAFGWVRD